MEASKSVEEPCMCLQLGGRVGVFDGHPPWILAPIILYKVGAGYLRIFTHLKLPRANIRQ